MALVLSHLICIDDILFYVIFSIFFSYFYLVLIQVIKVLEQLSIVFGTF